MKQTPPYLLLLVLLGLGLNTQAQSHFLKGSVTRSDGSVGNGWIDYREWELNPEHIRFRAQEGAAALTYGADDISAFEVDGIAYYRRALVTISMDKRVRVEAGMQTGPPEKSSRTATVFLQQLRTGPSFALYGYTDAVKTRYYVLNIEKNIYTELTYQRYYDYHEPPRVITNNLFRNQLQAFTATAPQATRQKLLRKLSTAEYTPASLSAIIDMLNGKTAKEQKLKLFFYAGLGISRCHGVYKNGYFFADGSSTKTSYMPKLSAGMDLFNKSRIKRIIFRADLSLTAAKMGITHPEASGKISSHHFSQYSLSLSPQVLFNIYNTDKLKVNAGVGVAMNFSAYKNEPVYAYNTIYPREEKVKLSPLWASFPVRAGVILAQKFDIYVQYNTGAYFTSGNTYFMIRSDVLQAGVNILFWK
ncbi:hypothetical protein [Taibaiella helva]|uniref:hypothetical protein n=1 Tax=Taibaiella helva TaxID=2301235 RepID=UPI000E579ACF|nr:hypothetical protein [Taibaiella helva]